MNWKEIKEKYPKALELIYEYADKYAIGAFMGDYKFDRLLYDLFDEQGIYINVVRMWYYEDTIKNSLHEFFDWEIIVEREFVSDSEVEEPTRTEAEVAAFNKAFEILEGRL